MGDSSSRRSILGFVPSPSATPALLQHPVGPKETCCVCSDGGNADPAHMELTVHEGPGFRPLKHSDAVDSQG